MRTGYRFGAWKLNGKAIKEDTIVETDKDHVLTASWSAISIFLHFDPNGGDCDKSLAVVFFDNTYDVLPSAVREGYAFIGWFTENGEAIKKDTIVSETVDQTLYAHWNANTYTVYFDGGDKGACTAESMPVVFGDAYGLLPEAMSTQAHYEFSGWYTAAAGGTKITEESLVNTAADHTLYAHWVGESHTVYFDANGGTCSKISKSVRYGAHYGLGLLIRLPTPERQGYHFVGWFTSKTGGEKITESTEVTTTEDETLYAQWSPRHYNVRFNGNGATAGGMERQYFTYDEEQNLFKNQFERMHTVTFVYNSATSGNTVASANVTHSFYGWSTMESGVPTYSDQQSVLNLATGERHDEEVNLYAIWALQSILLPQPQREGYLFNGWYTDEALTTYGGKTTYYPKEDVTLYAKWTPKTMRVFFDANGGDCDTVEKKVTFDSIYGDLPTAIRNGYTFLGWFTEDDKEVTAESIFAYTENQTLYSHWKTISYIVTPSGASTVIDEESGNIYGLRLAPTERNLEAYLSTQSGTALDYKTTGYIGTGTQIDVLDATGTVVQTYTIVIFGDTDGDGTVTQSDIAALKAHMNGADEIAADDPRYLAGDVDGDGFISLMDITMMKGMMNGSVELDQATRKSS